MVSWPYRYRLAALAVLLAALSGCRQTHGPRGFRLPWSSTAWGGPAPASPQPAESQPLRPEQKADIQLALARGLEQQGRTADAKQVYLEAIKTAPQRADAYHLLALLHDRNGECQTAEKYYREALQRDVQNAELHCDLGYSCYLRQRWPDAETHLRRAIALAPEQGRPHTNLGLLLARTGREGEALEEFARAGCSPAAGRSNLAYVFTLTGRWEEAQAEFRSALALDPNLQSARDGLAKLQTLVAQDTAAPPRAESPPTWEATPAAFLAPDRR